MAQDDLTFNVIGATMESPSQPPPPNCLYKPGACGKKELLRGNPCRLSLSLTLRGAGLVDSRLTFPRDPSALFTASLFLRSAPRRNHILLLSVNNCLLSGYYIPPIYSEHFLNGYCI